MKIISIINLKGGVAKTLTADNMAHVLAFSTKSGFCLWITISRATRQRRSGSIPTMKRAFPTF